MKTGLCELVPPQIQPQNQGPFTVGHYLYLSCRPDTVEATEMGDAGNSQQLQGSLDWSLWDLKNIRFKLKGEETEFIKSFNAETEPGTGRVILKIALYKAGPQPLEELSITDGSHEMTLQGEPIEIKSVIQQPSGGQPVKPFGPVLPITLSTPLSYYIIFLASLLALGLLVFLKLRSLSYEKQLKSKLRDYESPLAPDTQIYRAIRLAEKAGYPMADLEKAFKIYLLRRYEVPMFDLSEAAALKYFKRRWPELKELRLSAYKILTELIDQQKREEGGRKEGSADILSLISKIYKFIETTESKMQQLSSEKQPEKWRRGRS